MPITVLVFVNYVHFSKYNSEIILLLFTLNLIKTPEYITLQQTSKRQTHLLYLHLETFVLSDD